MAVAVGGGGTVPSFVDGVDGSRWESGAVAPLCTRETREVRPAPGRPRHHDRDACSRRSCHGAISRPADAGIPALTPLCLKAIAPWAVFIGLLAPVLLYFVGAEQGATALVSGEGIHEWVHDGRHLLGFRRAGRRGRPRGPRACRRPAGHGPRGCSWVPVPLFAQWQGAVAVPPRHPRRAGRPVGRLRPGLRGAGRAAAHPGAARPAPRGDRGGLAPAGARTTAGSRRADARQGPRRVCRPLHRRTRRARARRTEGARWPGPVTGRGRGTAPRPRPPRPRCARRPRRC